MFLGGSAGSTSGGIKVVRHLMIVRNGVLEFKRTLHPNAILPVRHNGKAVKKEIVFNILAFFILYLLAWIKVLVVWLRWDPISQRLWEDQRLLWVM